jgi:hypothetical protein
MVMLQIARTGRGIRFIFKVRQDLPPGNRLRAGERGMHRHRVEINRLFGTIVAGLAD